MNQKEDILNRQKFIDDLIEIVNYISEKKTGCCFAIDGQWGTGKTFVLDMFEQQISQIQSEETNDNKYFVFNYNCWKYDYYDEPSIAIVSSMLDKLEQEEQLFGEKTEDFLKSSWGIAKKKIAQIAGEFSKNKIGINLVELVKDINDDVESVKAEKYDFDKMFSFKKTLTDTRKKLEELSQYKSIIFIVDELDRCLPSYAIKVLERLHHIFDGIDNITVIISIDRTQLEHSIQQIYGTNVDVDKYLKKFINFSLILNKGTLNSNFQTKYSQYFNYFYDIPEPDQKFFSELFSNIFNGIDIRTQEKLIYRAMLIHEILCNDEKLNPALLCFEIMWVALTYRYNGKHISWMPQTNSYAGLADTLGHKLDKYLKDTEKSVGNSENILHTENGNFRMLDNVLKDDIFWIFAAKDNPVTNNTCLKYYNENANSIENEVALAKMFVALSKILK